MRIHHKKRKGKRNTNKTLWMCVHSAYQMSDFAENTEYPERGMLSGAKYPIVPVCGPRNSSSPSSREHKNPKSISLTVPFAEIITLSTFRSLHMHLAFAFEIKIRAI
jgi:hypothetical protein